MYDSPRNTCEVVAVAPGDQRYVLVDGWVSYHSHMDSVLLVGDRKQILSGMAENNFTDSQIEEIASKFALADANGSSSSEMQWDSPYYIAHTVHHIGYYLPSNTDDEDVDGGDSANFAVMRSHLLAIADDVAGDERKISAAVAKHATRVPFFTENTQWADVMIDARRCGIAESELAGVNTYEYLLNSFGHLDNPLMRVLVQGAIGATKDSCVGGSVDGASMQHDLCPLHGCNVDGQPIETSAHLSEVLQWVPALGLLVQDYDTMFTVESDEREMVDFIIAKMSPVVARYSPDQIVELYETAIGVEVVDAWFEEDGVSIRYRGFRDMMLALDDLPGALDIDAVRPYLNAGIEPSLIPDAIRNGVDVDFVRSVMKRG